MQFVTSDVTRFWQAFDTWQTQEKSDPTKLEAILQRGYIDKGTPGLAGFIPHRIESAKALSAMVLEDIGYYREMRPISQSFQGELPRLSAICEAMQTIDPATRVPTIYLVIGRRSSGGTSSDAGLIIGAEMFSTRAASRLHPEDFVALVAHELVHFQQKDDKDAKMADTLLRFAMVEGAADFMAELLAGHHIDESAKPYADSHEQELWESFRRVMNGTATQDWLYNSGQVKPGLPPDLGYYEGYKVCQSYLQSHKDKPAALRRILEMEDASAVLAESYYADRFK